MIHEVDEALKSLLSGGALAGSGIEVALEAPTRDWVARRNAPTIGCYLYDIREEVNRRQQGTITVRDEQGAAVNKQGPLRWYRLSYLITAWTKQPQDEHRMLSAVLATLIPHDKMPAEKLSGTLAALALPVHLAVGRSQNDARSSAELWSALGGELKPSLDMTVIAPFPVYPEFPVAPPVLEGVVQVRGTHGTLNGSVERSHKPRHFAPRPNKIRGPRL